MAANKIKELAQLVTPMRASSVQALGLGHKLRELAESRDVNGMPVIMQMTLVSTEEVREDLADEKKERLNPQDPTLIGPLAQRARFVWSGLNSALQFARRLPTPTVVDRVSEIQAVLDTVFKGGLKFQTLKLEPRWLEAEARRQLLHENHAGIVDEVAGSHVRPRLNETHEILGRALGLLDVPEVEDPRGNVAALTRQLMTNIGLYVGQGVSWATMDPSKTALVEYLLAPVLAHRDARKKAREEAKAQAKRAAAQKKADGKKPVVEGKSTSSESKSSSAESKAASTKASEP